MSSGLYLPPSALPPARPAPPVEQTNQCLMCGIEMPAGELRPFLRHVKRCMGAHQDDMTGAIREHARSIFTGASPDPEKDAHFARGGN